MIAEYVYRDAFDPWAADILSDQRRVKLLMQVFLYSHVKVERLALRKLKTWWHFIIKLADRISLHFDKVGDLNLSGTCYFVVLIEQKVLL